MYKRWIISFGGAGLLPAMPGTFGSLAAAIVFYLLWLAFGETARWIVLALLPIVAGVGIGLGRWAEDYYKTADPQQFVLDEVVDSLEMVVEGVRDQAMDVINLKISKIGGLTKARQIRDLCVSLGIALTIEDTWGGDIITAAIAHLAHSTPPAYLFTATDFNSYVSVSNAAGAPQRKDGRMAAPSAPGLGVEPRWEVVGKPVISV